MRGRSFVYSSELLYCGAMRDGDGESAHQNYVETTLLRFACLPPPTPDRFLLPFRFAQTGEANSPEPEESGFCPFLFFVEGTLLPPGSDDLRHLSSGLRHFCLFIIWNFVPQVDRGRSVGLEGAGGPVGSEPWPESVASL